MVIERFYELKKNNIQDLTDINNDNQNLKRVESPYI